MKYDYKLFDAAFRSYHTGTLQTFVNSLTDPELNELKKQLLIKVNTKNREKLINIIINQVDKMANKGKAFMV
ncbi:hypothetical protein [Paenibacillus cremeus]|uniref:Uncharacterized protein n=1 Tax=Paenibacillus cremeus TaxID=2163881 RepID=A0A559KCS0_9BACL|nr:hypothetical protein [Paenibacillus cremeus]TVY09928.1 hypothetical protein FPZ49_11190 [Paenibacillus cremeus]